VNRITEPGGAGLDPGPSPAVSLRETYFSMALVDQARLL
jgi:hypothetical protein